MRIRSRFLLVVSLALPNAALATPIQVEDLTPLATDVIANGSGIAAKNGFVYVEDFSGSSGMNSRVFRIGPDGSVDPNWLTGVVAGFKPYVSPGGQLWLIGNDYDFAPPERPIARIDAFDPSTGASLGPVFVEGGDGYYVTTVTVLQDGSVVYGTSDFPTNRHGIRKVIAPNQSSMISEGFGNNTHVATAADGRLLLGQGPVFGYIDATGVFQQVMRLQLPISAVVPLPGGTILLATNGESDGASQASVWQVSADFSTTTEFLRTVRHGFYFAGFRSLTLDADRNELVALISNGSVYVIPVPDGTVSVRPVTWGTLKGLYR